METVTVTLKIDVRLMKKQKRTLLEIMGMTCFTKKDIENLTGILNTLDGITDCIKNY